MGLLDRRSELQDAKDASTERDANPETQWEYKARNLAKVPGVATEDDFNRLGQQGWELVAVAQDYAIFKRPIT